jgi:uncharacterized integral membrane protein (TIGR00697 family)
MMNKKPTKIVSFPKHLWFLMLSYSMVIVLANWVDARLIQLGPLMTDAGTLVFPITFLLSDMITEVYGYKNARRAIWCGFFFNFIFIFYGLLISALPSPEFANTNEVFDTLLAVNFRIVVASTISYITAEPLNAFIMASLKIRMHGKHMWARFMLSTFLASAIDSIIFSVLAFWGMMPFRNLCVLMFTMWFLKVIIELIGLPISIPITNRLKQSEKLDVFDNNTKFNLFNLDEEYLSTDNHYHANTKEPL